MSATTLQPWANGPFELLLHAEGHLQDGEDFDRRMALITFDNAIEVSITTYLSLKPIMRGNRSYATADVESWTRNYHTKLDFLEEELQQRSLTWNVEKTHIIWAHDHRNEQYHGGSKGTPEKQVLGVIREAALWVFSILYDVSDPETLLLDRLSSSKPTIPERDDELDRLIDEAHGLVRVAGQPLYASEVLFFADYTAYRDIGAGLRDAASTSNSEDADD